jgi:hypothetical protein
MRKSKFSFLPLFGLALILILSGLGFMAMQNPNFNLDFRRQAAGEQLSVTLGNSSTKIQPNQAVTVDLMVNTQGKFVSGFQFSGTITGVNQDKTGIVISQISGLNPIFSEINKVGNDLHFKFVDLASLGSTAFTTHDQNQKLATFNLYPLQSGEVKLSFNQNDSGAMEFGKSFLSSNVAEQKYTIEVTNSTGGSSNAPADAGIHRSCNQYCADSRECATEFSCWYNRCRNPKNLTEEKCTEPVVVKPAAPVKVATVNVTSSSTKGGTATPTPAPKTAVATVIITTASSSTKTATVSSTPSPTPRLSTVSTSSSTTKSLATNPSPSPVALANTSQSSSSLGLLIGAAIATGLLAFVAIIFFLKNRNR